MSIEMSAGVLVADMLEGMKFALGPTMAIRRSCLEEIRWISSHGGLLRGRFSAGELGSGAGAYRRACRGM